MRANFGGNQAAETISLWYEGSDTIYEGMALCYNSDTTTNWFGYDPPNGTYNSTTAESYQNEGKFNYVECPAVDNLMFFAGVVAGSSPNIGKSGPCRVDLYRPNGAIVPVRASIKCYEGETPLGIQATDYEFQCAGVYATNRVVACAVAVEDADRSSTEGLCLAAIFSPFTFSWQSVGFTGETAGSSQRWNVGEGVSSGNVIPICQFYNTRQTGGEFNAQRIRVEALGAGVDFNLGGVLRAELDINAAATTGQVIGAYLMFSDGATAAFTDGSAIEAKIEHADAAGGVLTGADLSVLRLNTLIYDSTPSKLSMIRCQTGGDSAPDYFLTADSASAIKFAAKTSAAVTHHIKICVAGTAYYVMVSDAN